MNENVFRFEAIVFLLSSATCLFGLLYWIILLKKRKFVNRRDLLLFAGLFVLSIGINLVNEDYLYYLIRSNVIYKYIPSPDFSLISGIVRILQLTVPISALALIIYKSRFVNKRDDGDNVNIFISRVLTDGKLATAFNTSLPRGSNDSELGIDYIPFLLQNAENKRMRFKKVADRFLGTTLILGFFFVVLVIVFGSILLNDHSYGINKSVTDLKREIDNANQNIRYMQGKSIQDQFQEDFQMDLGRLSSELKSDKNKFKKSISNSIDAVLLDQNFNRFKLSVKHAIDSLNNVGLMDGNSSIQVLVTNIDKYESGIENAKSNFIFITRNLMDLYPSVLREVDKPSNQLNELIKRLILSIVICTFFLAILRYTAKLYSINQRLMILAEDEDLAVRKFYIALKNTDKNNEERKMVINNFLNGSVQEPAGEKKPSDLSKDEAGILKDLLNSLLKKI